MKVTTLILTLGIVATVVGAPLWYKVDKHSNYRNLRVVDPSRLYRSGQLTPEALDRTLKEKGIKTVISLREKKDDSLKEADKFEEKFCIDRGIVYRRLDVPDWNPDTTGAIPGERPLGEFRDLVEDKTIPKPMLIHCFAGEHRTGALVAVYRMEYNGWTNADAIEEMTSMGNVRTTFSDTLIRYLSQYSPRKDRGQMPNER